MATHKINHFTPKVIIRPNMKSRFDLPTLELLENVKMISKHGTFNFKKGFISDGGTIPYFLRSTFPPFDRWLGAVFIHDQFCDLATKTGLYAPRKEGDNLFYDLLRECGIARWRAYPMSVAVKSYGKYLLHSGKLKK